MLPQPIDTFPPGKTKEIPPGPLRATTEISIATSNDREISCLPAGWFSLIVRQRLAALSSLQSRYDTGEARCLPEGLTKPSSTLLAAGQGSPGRRSLVGPGPGYLLALGEGLSKTSVDDPSAEGGEMYLKAASGLL